MRLLLVEGHQKRVAHAMAARLVTEGFEVTRAPSTADALHALRSASAFDVVLLDLELRNMDGFEVCHVILKVTTAPVIIVTARADVRSRIHGLNIGAADYVIKPFDMGELIARAHAVVRRHALGARGEKVVRLGPVRVDLAGRRVTVDGRDIKLTRKEFDLLALLASSPGVVFRREQILSRVWHSHADADGHKLTAHIASLRAKLGVPALIRTVRFSGYCVDPAQSG